MKSTCVIWDTLEICLLTPFGIKYKLQWSWSSMVLKCAVWILWFSLFPQFRSIIPCEVLLYIEVTFWDLSTDLGIFLGSWFLHRHKIPHPNQWGSMITTKKYCLFYEDFSVVGFICIYVQNVLSSYSRPFCRHADKM